MGRLCVAFTGGNRPVHTYHLEPLQFQVQRLVPRPAADLPPLGVDDLLCPLPDRWCARAAFRLRRVRLLRDVTWAWEPENELYGGLRWEAIDQVRHLLRLCCAHRLPPHGRDPAVQLVSRVFLVGCDIFKTYPLGIESPPPELYDKLGIWDWTWLHPAWGHWRSTHL